MTPSCPDLSLIIPTRNRRAILGDTLRRLAECVGPHIETIVIDNGSTDDTLALRAEFPRVRWIELGENLAAAARNVGAAAADGRILFMLDDDSWPDPGVLEATVRMFDARPDLGAVGCRVLLADGSGRHDAGGVPGMFFNCGGAVRRDAFLAAGGYPPDYEYYVEEYALACQLWRMGWAIEPHGDLVVHHARVTTNRDNNRMLRLLVRNNLRLWNRYAPDARLADLCASTLERYARVARRENAWAGYKQGAAEGQAEQRSVGDLSAPRPSGSGDRAPSKMRRSPLTESQFAGLFGLDAARAALGKWLDETRARQVGVWSRGKGCEQVLELLSEFGVEVAGVFDDACEATHWRGAPLRHAREVESLNPDGLIIGSLSPGVAEDAANLLRRQGAKSPIVLLAPWAHSKLDTRLRLNRTPVNV